MILTKERAEALHADKIFFEVNSKPPTDEKYGTVKIGHDFKPKEAVRIEERTGLYKFPYKPSIGGTKYSGLCSMGVMSYSWSPLPEPLKVGRYCSISSGIAFIDSFHPMTTVSTSLLSFATFNHLSRDLVTKDMVKASGWHVRNNKPWPTIGHDVWIGRDVTIALGVNIGTGSVIAAGSVVTKDVAPYSIVGGNPAKHIRQRFPEEIATGLLALEWWDYAPADLVAIGMHDPVAFAATLSECIKDGTIQPYRPTTWIIGKNDSVERMQGG
ncbi:CatB-related O-acetyltransferase [Sphingobium sp. ZW T5_29]|uniref:CatB-related O-acetyltransferase n=1 Tax=Sphingobium sp. ZW T5_29 TaxID=3378077 RepID=UPI0038544DD6